MFKKLSVLLALISITFIFNACKENSTVPDLPIKAKQFEFLQNVVVGNQPAEVFYDKQKNVFHIFCLGVDANFNGVKDAGDENPSWWVIDKNDITKATKVRDFDFGSIGFPFRPFVDIENRNLIFSQNGKIKEYNLDNYSLISDNIADFSASAVWKNGDVLFFSISTGYTTPGYVLAYNFKTKKVLDSINAGINVQQILGYSVAGEKRLAVLSEGTANNDAVLQFLKFSDNKFTELKKIDDIGNNANQMSIKDEQLALTMNGSHKILIFNLNNYSLINTIQTSTDGYKGPRESYFDGFGNIYITTYTNDVREFNLSSGELIKKFDVDSKAEGITIVSNEFMLVCNISKSDYSANNIVSIFKAKD